MSETFSESFRITETIARAPSEVLAALTQPAELEQYFLTSASASPLDAREITWRLPDYAPLRLEISALRSEHLLEFRWKSPEIPVPIVLRFELSPSGHGTQLSISESGWQDNDSARQESSAHEALWTRLAQSLKAHLEGGAA